LPAPMASPQVLRDENPDQTLFASGLVQIGRFRCPVEHPKFIDSGPAEHYCFVFPRTPVWIQHEGGEPFVADPTVVTLYNPGHRYRRGRIALEGDHADWFAVELGVLREALRWFDPETAEARHRLFRA